MVSKRKIEEFELERRLLKEYRDEVEFCDRKGQSTQHIGDEWMRRKIREICGYAVSDRWIKQFRKRNSIRYFSGRRHVDQNSPIIDVESVEKPAQVPLRERRVSRISRREYGDVDARVADEIRRRHAIGERLTNPWIREFAQEVAKGLYPKEKAEEIAKFFDVNWLYRFKRRYCVDLKPQSTTPEEAPSSPREVHKPIPLYFDYHFYTQVLLMNVIIPDVILPQNVIQLPQCADKNQ